MSADFYFETNDSHCYEFESSDLDSDFESTDCDSDS